VIIDNIFLIYSIYSKRLYIIYWFEIIIPINSYVIDYYRLLLTSHISAKKLFSILQTIRVDYAQLSYIRTHTNKTSKNVWKKIRKQRDTKVPLIANYLILHLSLQRIRIFKKINYKKERRERNVNSLVSFTIKSIFLATLEHLLN